jgi:hypothetical protein
MVQSQLVDYIGAQFKAGVSRETVRAALIGVGWQMADIDETLQKVEADTRPGTKPAVSFPSVLPLTSPVSMPASAPATRVVGTLPNQPMAVGSPKEVSTEPLARVSFGAKPLGSPAVSGTVFPNAAKPASGTGSFSPMDVMGGVTAGAKLGASGLNQPVRPSVGASVNNPFGVSKGTSKVDAFTAGARFNNPGPTGTLTAVAAGQTKVSHTGERVSMVAEAVGLVALAALSVYFFTQNSALTAKVSALNAAGGGATAATSDLTTQVQTLTKTNGDLTTQVGALTAQTADLKTQLGFFALPQLGVSSTPIVVTGSVSGILSTSTSVKGFYSIRTPYDVIIFVKNGNDPKVIALLKPLIGATATLEGSYVLGSEAISVTSVNGGLVNPLIVVSTSTSATTTTTTATVTTVTTTTVTTAPGKP